MPDAPFTQITGTKYTVYALDTEGVVWQYRDDSRRTCSEPHHNHTCEYQKVQWWQALPVQRGWLGWPPTEREIAEREVEELLGGRP